MSNNNARRAISAAVAIFGVATAMSTFLAVLVAADHHLGLGLGLLAWALFTAYGTVRMFMHLVAWWAEDFFEDTDDPELDFPETDAGTPGLL